MRKITAFLLIFFILVALSGCDLLPKKYEEPVNFYYLRAELTYGSDDSVIGYEVFDAAGHQEDYLYLLSQYLRGPESSDLAVTFPPNITVEDFYLEEGEAYLQLESDYSILSGLDLSVACACLTRTVIELANVETVHIATNSKLLDGSSVITMTMEDILLLDMMPEAYTE